MPDKDVKPEGLTRRDALRVLGVSAGLAMIAPLSGCSGVWERQPVIPWMPGTRESAVSVELVVE